jgi:hypothetical protein
MAFNKIASLKAFANDVEPNSRRPNFSNSKCRIEKDIPAGEYSMGVWQNEDGNLSVSLEQRTDDVGGGDGFVQPAQPGPHKGGISDDFDTL